MVGTSTSGNRAPKDTYIPLYLCQELIWARARCELDMHLGPSYACQLGLIEGWHLRGWLPEPEYLRLKAKFSEPKPVMEEKPLSPKQTAENSELINKDRFFKTVLTQWDEHASKIEWQVQMFTRAGPWKDKLQSARDILAKDTREPKIEGAI